MCNFLRRCAVVFTTVLQFMGFGLNVQAQDGYPMAFSSGHAVARYVPSYESNNGLQDVFSSLRNIDELIRDLDFRARSTSNPMESREIRFLITQLIETRNQIERTKNTMMQMRNLNHGYLNNLDHDYSLSYHRSMARPGYLANQGSSYYSDMLPYAGGAYGGYSSYSPYSSYSNHARAPSNFGYPRLSYPARYVQSGAYDGFDSREMGGYYNETFPQLYESHHNLNPAYFVDDDLVVGATNMQLNYADSNMYDLSLNDFVDAKLPTNRVNPYSSNLQLSESGQEIIKARLELAKYLFFNNLKARGLFVIRDLLHSISVEDTWSMHQILSLGEELAVSSKHRDVAMHIFRLGFKKYRGLPVAARFLIRAGMVAYRLKDNKDACLAFMTVRDGYPYEKKLFIHADVMSKKLNCPPSKVKTDIIW